VTSTARAIDPLLDDAPCGFVAFGDDGTLRVVNRTLAALLGFAPDELEGRHVESILAVGSRIFYQTHLFPMLRLHGHVEEIFLLLRGKHGEDVAALANAVRRERDGEWVSDVVMMRILERRKFEDALLEARRTAEAATAAADQSRRETEEANELLERQALELELSQEQLREQAVELEHQRAIAEAANRAKSAFLAMMSHELRTPLNAIGGYVQLLEMGVHGPVTDAQADALGRVLRSQRHLLNLINDLLNLARIESGRVEFKLGTVSLDDVVKATLPMIEPQLTARKLTCEAHVPHELTVFGDREKIEQILLNLLSNASKFTPPGGNVRVTARAAPERKGRVQLSVTDTGVGIAPDKLEQVFQPFTQIDASYSTRKEGTGLGLSISRELARGMSGELTATSVPGVGSTFTLELPAA
jgi:PAS domain S-box-containing protein